MSSTIARRVRATAAVVGVALALAACGSGTTPQLGDGGTAAPGGSGDAAIVWGLEGGQSESYLAAVDRWNEEHPDRPIELQMFGNQGYKDKLRIALGAGQGPDLMFSWGGAALKTYVDAGYVEPIEDPAITDRYLPSVLDTVTFDGKVYGAAINNIQPVVILYNDAVFRQVGAEPPTTWDELLDLVPVFEEEGIAPIALAGQSKWPQLPYLGYLVDRIGGPEVFDAIVANEPDAWSHPAVTQALTEIQTLVEAGGFVDDYASIAYETGAADALLYTGRAAMMVVLSQAYSNIKTAAPDFVESGDLKAVPFPAYDGGAGDPANLVGNPSNFWSVNASASDEHKETVLAFLAEQVMNEEYIGEILDRSAVPGVTTARDQITEREDTFAEMVVDLTEAAPHFQLSWDQAISPSQAEQLTTHLDRVFLLQTTPEEFVSAMNATLDAK
ncbi:extracellular solute-binding protein [Cellulomonas sp. zg-ZUI222]|uniref:ABC transporter substrate-binding protein n=1 Tax=Cellulomonas TaxID=1707 RepID=UPI001A93AFD7|nr:MULTISPECIES: extracellular solute-binding protein [Cellulomonas]MBO0898437.1 extracellular solute-binding protein [Cellulomonas sp. zg-ZUI22]MBO0919301.1 extracellular solute-binding protein [Cellulomonas wangleii]